MRSFLLCVTFLLFGLVSRAQSNMASLNIILTDVQSVTFSNTALNEVSAEGVQISRNEGLNVFSRSTSQVKQISSKNSDYDKLYKEFYIEKARIDQRSSNTNNYSVAINNAISNKLSRNQNTANLVIYQIDPR